MVLVESDARCLRQEAHNHGDAQVGRGDHSANEPSGEARIYPIRGWDTAPNIEEKGRVGAQTRRRAGLTGSFS